MSDEGRDEPVRSCVGCRQRRRRSRLVRITGRDGRHVVGGASDGRGAWLCRGTVELVDGECLDLAIRRRGLARAWRRDVDDDEAVEIRRAVRRAAGPTDEHEQDAH